MRDDLASIGRLAIEARLTTAERDRDDYLANLTATQMRCTELLEENRVLLERLAARDVTG